MNGSSISPQSITADITVPLFVWEIAQLVRVLLFFSKNSILNIANCCFPALLSAYTADALPFLIYSLNSLQFSQVNQQLGQGHHFVQSRSQLGKCSNTFQCPRFVLKLSSDGKAFDLATTLVRLNNQHYHVHCAELEFHPA